MRSKNPGESAAALNGRRILVVEDEYFLGDDLAKALRDVGAEIVGPIGELTEALQALDAPGTIDAAVLDINLRGEMAFPVARTLRERGVPFVFATGYSQTVVEPEFNDVPRWEKPFDAAALARAMPGLVRSF